MAAKICAPPKCPGGKASQAVRFLFALVGNGKRCGRGQSWSAGKPRRAITPPSIKNQGQAGCLSLNTFSGLPLNIRKLDYLLVTLFTALVAASLVACAPSLTASPVFL